MSIAAVNDSDQPLSVQLSHPYMSQASIDALLAGHRASSGLTETRESQMTFSACSWMYAVGKALQFPVRTIGTAMMIYHRFLLFYSTNAFVPNDVSPACLFVASKMQDTAKKARDILVMAHSVRNPQGPEVNTESPAFEEQRRRVLGLERMILETQSFDFRLRHPQPFIIKFARLLAIDQTLTLQAWQISIDSYRTWIPLKLPPHVIALACLILAGRISGYEVLVRNEDYDVKSQHLYTALEGLLDLYLHARSNTTASCVCSESKLMEIKSTLIRESTDHEGRVLNGINGSTQPKDLTSVGDRGTCRYLLDPERLLNDKTTMSA